LKSVDFPTFGRPTIAVCSFIFSVVLEYDLELVLETGESVWVKDDRATNAIDRLVMAASIAVWSRIFIRGDSMMTV
jgi:hypothetical protein